MPLEVARAHALRTAAWTALAGPAEAASAALSDLSDEVHRMQRKTTDHGQYVALRAAGSALTQLRHELPDAPSERWRNVLQMVGRALDVGVNTAAPAQPDQEWATVSSGD